MNFLSDSCCSTRRKSSLHEEGVKDRSWKKIVPDSVAPVIIGSGYCLIEVKIKLSSTEKSGISVVNNTAR